MLDVIKAYTLRATLQILIFECFNVPRDLGQGNRFLRGDSDEVVSFVYMVTFLILDS